ncbi:MAG: hypothetical protein BWX47_01643 [candidate division Hyd24-12 bacterium ADurb.Bin004]|jgi:hypothetical protein|nr:MAG: hypothetical protein BWX47_01643 [candidate division Hyd24-12 bacterium ADurb.Bin004]
MFVIQAVELKRAVSAATHPEKALAISEEFVGVNCGIDSGSGWA